MKKPLFSIILQLRVIKWVFNHVDKNTQKRRIMTQILNWLRSRYFWRKQHKLSMTVQMDKQYTYFNIYYTDIRFT